MARREEQREMRAWKKIKDCRSIEEVNKVLIDEDIENKTAERLTADWNHMNRIINFRILGMIPA